MLQDVLSGHAPPGLPPRLVAWLLAAMAVVVLLAVFGAGRSGRVRRLAWWAAFAVCLGVNVAVAVFRRGR